jgi:hypothetical protein
MNNVLFFSGCDAEYFELCMDLIASLRRARGRISRMRIFDLGLLPHQLAELEKHVEAVIEPDWDLGQSESYPPWFRAMTSRPFLPKYASDAEIIVWIDSDAWVQSWGPVNELIRAAGSGKLAIVEEQFGTDGLSVPFKTPAGTFRLGYSVDNAKAPMRRCYEQCFGPEMAAAYGELPMFNSGVFALRADSPTWGIWRDVVTGGLQGGFHKWVEQQALCIAIRQGRVPVALQAAEANFVCAHALPWFDPANRQLTLPKKKHVPLGIVHLTTSKQYKLLPIPNFPHGNVLPMSLRFRDLAVC